MRRAEKEYLIVDKETKQQLAKELFPVRGSRVNKTSAQIRLTYANNDAGFCKYKIIRGESFK